MPTHGEVTAEQFCYLSAKKSWRLPIPKALKNKAKTPIISITHFCRWLADYASSLGIEIFPGFAASQLIFNDNNEVCGVQTGDMGIDKNHQPTDRFQAGMNLLAPTTLLAEGCHGSLSEQVIKHYQLRSNQPQTYGLGIREVWQVQNTTLYQPGTVVHTLGWPLPDENYGGGFIYHLNQQQVAIGFVVGLDYQNPTTNPHQIMQQFKTHPSIAPLLKDGTRLHYGAKSLVEGGWQSLPQFDFPGGALIGDSAGLLNVAKLKGIHSAMQSGIIAADAIAANLQAKQAPNLAQYTTKIQDSNMVKELYKIRNIRPGFKRGQRLGLLHAALDQYLFYGRAPWTLNHRNDHLCLIPTTKCQAIAYPKADGVLTFDKPSSLYLSHTQHEEDQPPHLVLKDPKKAITVNWAQYGSPEQYYCPAGVYELDNSQPEEPKLLIHASNCLHCKTCSIKDPGQNITWQAPQGGEGPNYED